MSVLVQVRCCGLSDRLAGNFNLRSEMMSLTGPGSRVAKAMCDHMIQKAEFELENRGTGPGGCDPPGLERTGWIALKSAIEFSKCMENSAFTNSSQIFAQLKGVGEVTARRLYASARSFEEILSMDAETLMLLTGHRSEWVQNLTDLIHTDIPIYSAHLTQMGYTPTTKCARVSCHFSLIEGEPKLRRPQTHSAHCIIGNLNKELVFYRRINVGELPLEFVIDVPLGTQLKACIVDDKIGSATTVSSACKSRRFALSLRSLMGEISL